MATLSVLTYNLSQGFKMKPAIEKNNGTGSSNIANSNNNGNSNNSISSSHLTKTFSKITVQNVLSENNANSLNISNNNAIVRKIKEFGMFGALNSISSSNTTVGGASKNNLTSRKRPLSTSKSSNTEKADNLSTKKAKVTKDQNANTPKTSKKVKNLHNSAEPKPAGTPGRKGLPLPQAVARRNARERNRVKQVNNGFAALRDRIPEEVAEAFESQGSSRGSAKKLSKVETLRMAVEYIRSLEQLLGFDFKPSDSMFSLGSGSDSNLLSSPENDNSFSLIKDEFDALSPSLDEHFDDSLSNYDVDDYFANSSGGTNSDFIEASNTYVDEPANDLPNITTLNGLQYIRIPGTNTYQLLTEDLFVNNSNSPSYQLVEDEQINNLIDSPNGTTPIVVSAAETHSTAPLTAITQAPAPVAVAWNGITGRATTLTTTNTTTGVTNGSYITPTTTVLSQSPVLQAASLPSSSSSSPNALQSNSEQRGKFTQPAMLSPATNELLLQTCAMERRLSNNVESQPTFMLQQQLPVQVKQEEFQDIHCDYTVNTNSNNKMIGPPTANSTLIYQSTTSKQQQQQQVQQQQQHHGNHKSLINQAPLAISPPLEGNNLISNILPSFFTQQTNACFQRILPHKTKFNVGLLDASSSGGATLTDEGMIEALDWWDQHTPKSDN